MDLPGFRLLSQESALSPFDATGLPVRPEPLRGGHDPANGGLTPGQAAMLALGGPPAPQPFDMEGYFVQEEPAAFNPGSFFEAGLLPPGGPHAHTPGGLPPGDFGGPFAHPAPRRFASGPRAPMLGIPQGSSFATPSPPGPPVEGSASTEEADDDDSAPTWARRPAPSAKEVVRRRRERRRRAAAMATKRRELARRGAAGAACDREERTVEKRTKKQIRTRENLERYRNKIKDKERRLAEEHEELVRENACLRRLLGRLEARVLPVRGQLV